MTSNYSRNSEKEKKKTTLFNVEIVETTKGKINSLKKSKTKWKRRRKMNNSQQEMSESVEKCCWKQHTKNGTHREPIEEWATASYTQTGRVKKND